MPSLSLAKIAKFREDVEVLPYHYLIHVRAEPAHNSSLFTLSS